MIETQKKGFKDMMNTIASIYSKPEPTQDTLRVWWAKLEKYEFMDVSHAFDDWVNRNKYMPTIADVLETLRANQPKDFVKALPRHFTEEEITSLIKKIALEDRIIVLSSHRQFTQDIMDEVIYMGES